MINSSNLFKMTEIEHMQNPPSCGGNWECGSVTRVCISRSPKIAVAMAGDITVRYDGVDGVPVLRQRVLTRGTKVLFDKWD
jgi:hypothetical protein